MQFEVGAVFCRPVSVAGVADPGQIVTRYKKHNDASKSDFWFLKALGYWSSFVT